MVLQYGKTLRFAGFMGVRRFRRALVLDRRVFPC